MNQLRNVLVFFGIVGALGTGCVIEVANRSTYDSCSTSDSCGGTSSCAPVTFNASTTQGSLCTFTCSALSPCPSGGLCVVATGGRGQCYRPCTSDLACGYATVCRSVTTSTGAAQICVPNTVGGAPACGALGQTCCAGNSCSGGLTCSGGTCARGVTAYQSCTPAGSTCSDGTSCIQALARGQTTPVGNTCTAICPGGAASMCPGYVPGQVECVNITGNPSMFQCVRLCNSAADCSAYGTQCLMVTSAGGAQIRICAP